MEKYVFIIELLVTKNLDKIDKDMTKMLLKIYDLEIDNDTNFFTKTIWYKQLKILAHLQYLQDFTDNINSEYSEVILHFIIEAYSRANENLSFLYFMKVVMLVCKKAPNNELYKKSDYFKKVLEICHEFFKNNYQEKKDSLIIEIVLYLVNYFKFLMNF